MPVLQDAIVAGVIYGGAAVVIGAIGRHLYKRRIRKSSTEDLESALDFALFMENDLIERNRLQSAMTEEQRKRLRSAKLAYYDLRESRRTVDALRQAITDKTALDASESRQRSN